MGFKNLPILILCYNKLVSLKAIITILKKLKFQKIYISVDGPFSKDDKRNLSVLKYINQLKKETNYKFKINNYNKGCKLAVSEGISWFFQKEAKGVILEEDCIPSKSFFKFTYLLLNRFKNKKNIGQISGTNPILNYKTDKSYFFSNYGGIWGWATWRDRWEKYDIDMKSWNKYNKFNLYYKSKNILDFLLRYYQLNKTSKNYIDTWDYQWTFTKIKNNYLSIIPQKNLITNVGFKKSAKHTFDKSNKFSRLKRYEIKFPLKHNENFEHCNEFYDEVVKRRFFNLIKKFYGKNN